MLSVWNKVNKRLQQRLKTDMDAPYPDLYLTSSDISDAPPKFPCLFVNSLGEPTQGSDFQNNQCYITSTIESKEGTFPDACIVSCLTKSRKDG
ncbi:hypothetical protein D7V86_25610, partial [bacterium D16-51]